MEQLIQDHNHAETCRSIYFNWSNMFIGFMFLLNNIILIVTILYVKDNIYSVGDDMKQYLNNYTLHIAFTK